MRLAAIDNTTGGYCGLLNSYVYYPTFSPTVSLDAVSSATTDAWVGYAAAGGVVGAAGAASFALAIALK